MDWKKATAVLALASVLCSVTAQADEIRPGWCEASRTDGEQSLEDLLAIARTSRPPVPIHAVARTEHASAYPFLAANGASFDARVDLRVTAIPQYSGPRPFAQPSHFVVEATGRFRPLAYVEQGGWLGWQFFKARYGDVHTGAALMAGGLSAVGEDYNSWSLDWAIQHGVPPRIAATSSAGTQTSIEFAGGLLLVGPNLILLPEALGDVPDQLGHGASEIVDGVRARDSKRASLGVAETMRAISTVAGAIALVAEGPKLMRKLGGADPALAARIEDARSTLHEFIKTRAEAERVGAATPATAPAIPETVANPFEEPGTPKASAIARWAEDQGWTRTQTPEGPPKYIDENGVARVTLKSGSSRTPGSETPHVELRDVTGQRIDRSGAPVARRSAGNHTPIEWDL